MYSFVSNRVMLKKEIMEKKVKRYVIPQLPQWHHRIPQLNCTELKTVVFFFHIHFTELFRTPKLSSSLEKHLYWGKHIKNCFSLTMCLNVELGCYWQKELLLLCDFELTCIIIFVKIEQKMSSLTAYRLFWLLLSNTSKLEFLLILRRNTTP